VLRDNSNILEEQFNTKDSSVKDEGTSSEDSEATSETADDVPFEDSPITRLGRHIL
jgi:hypothetical protein